MRAFHSMLKNASCSFFVFILYCVCRILLIKSAKNFPLQTEKTLNLFLPLTAIQRRELKNIKFCFAAEKCFVWRLIEKRGNGKKEFFIVRKNIHFSPQILFRVFRAKLDVFISRFIVNDFLRPQTIY